MNRSIKFIAFLIIVSFVLSRCAVSNKVKDGESAFAAMQYANAISMLYEEYNDAKNPLIKSRKAFKLGMSYYYLEEVEQSAQWLQKAANADYGNEALLYLADAQKKLGNYKAALGTYEKLKSTTNNTRLIDREIYVLKDVTKWSTDTDESYTIQVLNENSGFSEYSPALMDDNYLVFTSDREEATGNDSYGWTGNKHSDLFVMIKSGSEVRKFDTGINTKHNEGTACFSEDGNEIIFTRCFVEGELDGYCKLFTSIRTDGLWSESIPLNFFNEDLNYGQPALIEGDSVLVFSAEKQDGVGGHDLYYSQRVSNEDGSSYWSEPFIMPQTVNTRGNEMFPTGNGDTLYFSSDYLAGLGGLDIFKTWLQPNGQWAPPQNMKKPINSSYDDFGYIVDNSASLRGSEVQKGYFTSTRKGYGKEDLYSYEQVVPENPTPSIDSVNTAPEIEIEVYLAGITKTKVYVEPDNPNSGENGFSKLSNCNAIITDDEGNVIEAESDENGHFVVRLERDKRYNIVVSKEGYLNAIKQVNTFNLDLKKGQLSTTLNETFVLPKIFRNIEINLENIYYNFNKYAIRDDAKPTLDSLAKLLTDNPTINIQLASHTDCRGDKEYNQILSQKRAESAIRYIAQKGIALSRLKAKGFGKSRPAASCLCDDCTDAEHQINRRTTFKILD